jgi:hypothetical protein
VKTVKGIELPINILVIIAVAVIVLLGVIALYFSGFMGPAGVVTQEAAKTSGCKLIMSKVGGCPTVDPAYTDTLVYDGVTFGLPKFDANGDGHYCYTGSTDTTCAPAGPNPIDTFTLLCAHYFSATTPATCRGICGCSG